MMGGNSMEILLEPVEESLMALPVLFLAYLLVEYLSNQDIINKVMKFGKVGPFIGSLLGSIPQCGFSVIAAKLYSMRYLTMGTLLAIFIATSDEALAIMAIHPDLWRMLALLIIIKIIIGTMVGFIVDYFNHKSYANYEYLQVEPCDCGCQNGIILPALRHTINIFLFILLIGQFPVYYPELPYYHGHGDCCGQDIADRKCGPYPVQPHGAGKPE